MEAFLVRQHPQQRDSSGRDDANEFEWSKLMKAAQQEGLTTEQRIAGELASCDSMLTMFNLKGGFRVVHNVEMTTPLMTRSGKAVPASHVRLSHVRVIGQAVPRSLFLYAHSYEDLEIGDLITYLGGVGKAFGLKNGEGVFGTAVLRNHVSVFQIGGVPRGHPGGHPGGHMLSPEPSR